MTIMAKAKKTGLSKRKNNGLVELQNRSVEYTQNKETFTNHKSSLFSPRNIILVAVLLLALLFWKFKGYFIAATVNGQPISRFELNDQLVRRFGQQILDNIVGERLILAAVRQKGIFITDSEIDSKVKQIEDKLKGKATLSEALTTQGLTMPMFRRQLEIQTSVEKLFDKEASVSSQDIDDYYSKNTSLYKNATDTASVKEEIKSLLKQQKTNDLFEKWFSEMRKNAKIVKFL